MITPVTRLRYRRPLTPRHAWSVDTREIFTASIAFNLRRPGSVDISDHGWAVAWFSNVPWLIDRSRKKSKRILVIKKYLERIVRAGTSRS